MTAIHRMVEQCRDGSLPNLVEKIQSGWVILGEVQIREGYCLLLPDPVVPTLNDLGGDERTQFLADMARLGDAVLAVTGAARINYEMLGNLEPALHAHVFPRFEDERLSVRTKPIWMDDWEVAGRFDVNLHGGLVEKLRAELGV